MPDLAAGRMWRLKDESDDSGGLEVSSRGNDDASRKFMFMARTAGSFRIEELPELGPLLVCMFSLYLPFPSPPSPWNASS